MDANRVSHVRPDFPFYAGSPVLLGARDWAVVLMALAAAFALLVAPQLRGNDAWGLFVSPLLFCGVPLVVLRLVAGRAWIALFRRIGLRDVAWMAGIAMLNLAITLVLGWLVSGVHHASANPEFGVLDSADAMHRVLAFAAMALQLLGEELFTILPFLACLWLLHTRWGVTRRRSIVIAWLASAIPFAAAHLPTYQWDVLQCFVIIGGARLVLSLAYLATRNLWVATGAHVLNDWILFSFGLLAAAHG